MAGLLGGVAGAVGQGSVGAVYGLERGRVAAGGVLRLSVPEAVGGKTVIGQLTVDRAVGAGFVTAFACTDGLPGGAPDRVTRSDLNFDGAVSPVASNRLIVKADDAGDICLFASQSAAIIVDLNAVTFDTGVRSFPNRRTDTRSGPLVGAGGVVRVHVPEARGGRTVVGQLTVDRAVEPGFVTAYPCVAGLPTSGGGASRSDLNYIGDYVAGGGVITGGGVGGRAPVASNRLIVQADIDGDICLYTLRAVAMIVDINGVADRGITSFPNRRTDTRTETGTGASPPTDADAGTLAAGSVLRVAVPEARGGQTVLGQLTVDRAAGPGFVTAYPCAAGVPVDRNGTISRSDLNVDTAVAPVASNRLIVAADALGEVCLYTSVAAALIVDVNGVAGAGISSFANRRVDTRAGAVLDIGNGTYIEAPVWPSYEPLPALNGVAALTGLQTTAEVAERPIVAVKIDNYRLARPQWGLDVADAVIEVNVEGVSRFIALYHSGLPAEVGPVRSARTGDFDLLSGMNRPIFAYSGANDGVLGWLRSAAGSGVLVDVGAHRSACYARSAEKPGPHNLLLDPACAISRVGSAAGPAQPLWAIDADWTVRSAPAPAEPQLTAPVANPLAASEVGPEAVSADTAFAVTMDGVDVVWEWDPTLGVYRRWQDGEPHVTMTGEPITAETVVVLSVEYVASSVDARSPEAVTVGSGDAVMHRDGLAIVGRWHRASAYAPFRFTAAAAVTVTHANSIPAAATRAVVDVPLNEGVTWLELERRPE